VQIGLGQTQPGVRQVGVDEVAGLNSLVTFLQELGHRKFGYVGRDTVSQRRREAILLAALKSRKLAIQSHWFVRLTETDASAIHAAMGRMLAGERGAMPTVVIAADDAMAQKVMRAFHEHGVRVPLDISLAGIDDIPAAASMIPALTSVRQPLEEMVQQAFQWVTGEGAGGMRSVVVPPSLSVRESCAGAKRDYD
jgi:LacI family transcriptional regulator